MKKGQIAYNEIDGVAECFLLVSPMAFGNMKIGIITECIQQLIIKLLNVHHFVSVFSVVMSFSSSQNYHQIVHNEMHASRVSE